MLSPGLTRPNYPGEVGTGKGFKGGYDGFVGFNNGL